MPRVRPEALSALRAELQRDPYLATALRVAPMQTLATMQFLDPRERAALLTGDTLAGVLGGASPVRGGMLDQSKSIRALVENVKRDPALATDLRVAPAQVLGRLQYLSATDRAWLLSGGLNRIVGGVPSGSWNFNPSVLKYAECAPIAQYIGDAGCNDTFTHCSTTRVSQLTGDIDPQGLPHPVQSSNYGIAGVDEGIPVWYNGTLYQFFGDVVAPGGGQSYQKAYAAMTMPAGADSLAPAWFYQGDPFGTPFRPLSVSGMPALGRNEGPVGGFGFSYGAAGSALWLFINQNVYGTLKTYITYTNDLVNFQWMRDICVWNPPQSWKFMQVSAWVVQRSDPQMQYACPPLPPGPEEAGALLWGSSTGSVYLAWMPMGSAIYDIYTSTIWYYTGTGNGWGGEAQATELVDANGIPISVPDGNRVSVTWLPDNQAWMMLYSKVKWSDWSGTVNAPVVARFALYPWGPWSQEAPLLYPSDAWGQYMFGWGAPLPIGCSDVCLPGAVGGVLYGAYHLPGLGSYDQFNSRLTLYWVVSTFLPYQVMLMKSVINIGIL